MPSKSLEIEIAGKTPDGGETKKTVKMDWPVCAVIIIGLLVAIGAVVPADVLEFIRNLPSWLSK